MIGLVGWRIATARTSGNHSSACRYKTGASCRASVAPASPGGSAPGGLNGGSGRCRRGPQPAQATHSGTANSRPARTRSCRRVTLLAASFRPEPPRPPEWLVVYPRRSSCESPVRRRTTLRRRCSSSHTIARDRHCRAHRAPARSCAIPNRSRHHRARTSRCGAPSADASQSTSQGPHDRRCSKSASRSPRGAERILRTAPFCLRLRCLPLTSPV